MSPNVDDLKQSRYLAQKDVDPPVLVTIQGYEEINLAKDGAEPQMRWILRFKELDKPMTLNTTNGQIIAAIIGSGEFDDWMGHKIVLYRDPNISFGGELVGGIRCRASRKAGPTNIPEPHPDIVEPPAKEKETTTGDNIPF